MPEPHPLQGESPSSALIERRAWIRYPCNLETASVSPAAETKKHEPATVRDISAAGIGLLLNRRIRPGTVLEVELPIPAKGFSRPIQARVMHASVHSGGGWLVGCTFARPLTEDELRALFS
jgi:hypothetical protein